MPFNYMHVNASTILTMFFNFFINIVLAATFVGFCAKQNKPPKSSKSDEVDRPVGGNDKIFTPPHISQMPFRSVLRQKHQCPIHGTCNDDPDDPTFSNFESDSQVAFDSTQLNTASASCLEGCLCFANQKRVRFQCPSTITSMPITFSFH